MGLKRLRKRRKSPLFISVPVWYHGFMRKTFAIDSLGCAKNLVDSELMADRLLAAGYKQVGADKAELLLVNTCAFIDSAKQEAINTTLAHARRREKRANPGGQKIIMTGCLSQRYAEELRNTMPEVDAFVGVDNEPDIVRIAEEVLTGNERKIYCTKVSKLLPDYGTREFHYTPPHFAYVKIAEGCNHACAYCAIPRIRGGYRSRPMANVLREIRSLVERGVREINIIAQDTTYYGMDRPASGENLSALLRAANELQGDFWLRVLYTHPAYWTDSLITTFAECEKIVKYVDIPLQHIAAHILEEQRRRTGPEHIKKLLRKLRKEVPGIGLRSTFISGLPGETEKDHEELCEFVREFRFERAGVFPYSREENTLAAKMDQQVYHATRTRRANELNMLLATNADEIGNACIGHTVRVLVDSPGIARGPWDAPDVDGAIHVSPSLPVGEFADVRIEDSIAYELFAEGAQDH